MNIYIELNELPRQFTNLNAFP